MYVNSYLHPLLLMGGALKLQPNPQSSFQQRSVARRKGADGLHDKPLFDGGDLRFDSSWDVQTRRRPILQQEVHILHLGRNWDHEQISSVAAAANDDARTNLAAGQVSEWNRKKDNVIFGEAH